jgi:hypothetical protein
MGLTWKTNLHIKESAKRLWGDTHKGETAIIVGNGDSLLTVPEEFLLRYPSFGANLIPMKPFQPTYFSCINKKYITKFAAEMYDTAANADMSFISDYHIKSNGPGSQKLYALDNVQLLGGDTIAFPGEFFMSGGTVTYVNLKIAYFMGFETVLLVGVDHNPDWTHFYGNHLNTPPSKRKFFEMTHHHFVASEVYKNAGRRVVNLSPPSALDEFFERGDVVEW